jgi:hypothetical protein
MDTQNRIVAHHSAGYVRLRQTWTKTRPVNLAIGERRARMVKKLNRVE